MPRLRKLLLRTALLLLLCWLLFLLADRLDPLPDVQASSAQVVLARDGQPLWRFADDEGVWRYPVTLGEVSPFYLQALLDYEDRWFYQHPGINPFALLRAAWLNLRHDRIVSGGSTLSMQVARIIEPHSRTFQGKLRQIWRTLQLEWHYSKDAILEIYLNRAPFGGTLEGVSAASWAYLSKPASELTPAEAALLAVLPQAPSRLRPDRHPLRAQAARDKLLHRLYQHKTWPTQQIDEALAEAIWLARVRSRHWHHCWPAACASHMAAASRPPSTSPCSNGWSCCWPVGNTVFHPGSPQPLSWQKRPAWKYVPTSAQRTCMMSSARVMSIWCKLCARPARP